MKQAGILAGVGLIFAYLLGLLPAVGWIFSFLGVILFLVGVYRISRIANDERIFRYFLLPMILSFVALVVAFFGLMGAALSALTLDVFALGASFVVLLIVVLILLIVSLVSYVKAYRLLAEVTGVSIFNTVATLYKWGAILLVVFGIGAILMIVGSIIAVVGFFSIEEKTSSA